MHTQRCVYFDQAVKVILWNILYAIPSAQLLPCEESGMLVATGKGLGRIDPIAYAYWSVLKYWE